jgi:hypothetical protein
MLHPNGAPPTHTAAMAVIDRPSHHAASILICFLAAQAMMDVDDHKMGGRRPETMERCG